MHPKSVRLRIIISIVSVLFLSVGIYLYIRQYLAKQNKAVETAVIERGERENIYSMGEYMDQSNTDSFLVSLDLTPKDNPTDPGKPAMIRALGSDSPAAYLPFSCERIHATKEQGICIRQSDADELATEVLVFDAAGKVDIVATTDGHPNRARISPDGKYAGYTSFTSGDGYDAVGFSTRTYLVDVENKKLVDSLENFELINEGKVINPIDKNYWGVTFYQDSNHFLATVMFGGIPYLVDGNIKDKRLTVMAKEIECPSISPDEKRIVYKKRGGNAGWQLYAMDLKSKALTPLAEPISVDDQAEWLDNENILYVRYNATAGKVNTMSLPADGSGTPQVFAENTFSPAVIR